MTNYPNVQTYDEAAAALGTRDHRKAANNTHLHRIDADTIAVRLHNTDVVVYHSNGDTTLCTGGYQTLTTKERLNRFTNYSVRSIKGRWFVNAPSPDDWSVPFVEGITITPGVDPNPVDTGAEDAHNRRLRKQIKDYVALYTDERQAELIEGAQRGDHRGDCLYCQIEMAEAGKDNSTYYGYNSSVPISNMAFSEHLLLHIEEGYTMASLMMLVVRAKRHGNPKFCVQIPDIVRADLGWFLRKRLIAGTVAVR